MEIRQPSADDIPAIRRLATLSFNVPPSWAEHGPPMRPEHMLGAFEGGALRAMARDIPADQWFGGRPVPCAAISSVATVPEVRGTGLGDRVMRELLERARGRGALVTSLFPATIPFYRRLGYEVAATWTINKVPLHAVPRMQTGVEVEEFTGDDPSELRACYRAFIEGETGPMDADDRDWWLHRVLMRWVRDEPLRAVVARGPDGVEGYAAFTLASRGSWGGFDVECTHLVARTPAAMRALFRYFGRFRGVGRHVDWHGRRNDPYALAFDEEVIEASVSHLAMTRLLDVPAALEARGYTAGVAGEAVIAVDDPVFDDNTGSFRIRASDGTVTVERTDDEPQVRMSIGSLSALFASFYSVRDLRRVSALESGDEAAMSLLEALFAGPPAWLIDHF